MFWIRILYQIYDLEMFSPTLWVAFYSVESILCAFYSAAFPGSLLVHILMYSLVYVHIYTPSCIHKGSRCADLCCHICVTLLERHGEGPSVRSPLCLASLTQHQVPRSVYVVCVLVVCFFMLLNALPLCECATICLSTLLWIGLSFYCYKHFYKNVHCNIIYIS